jgi:hypothetical protein
MKRLIDGLSDVYDSVYLQTEQLKFNKDIAKELYSVCLHGSILENASACLTLLKSEKWNAVPILLRSLLEAYVDLINVIDDEHYSSRMQASCLNEQSRLLSNAIEHGKDNPYLADLSQMQELSQHTATVKGSLKSLRANNLSELRIKDRFKQAGLEELYDSVYALLCQHSHNNLNVLENRHLIRDGDDLKVAYFQSWSAIDILKYVDTIGGTVAGSLQRVVELLGITDDVDMKSVESAFSNLRGTYKEYT